MRKFETRNYNSFTYSTMNKVTIIGTGNVGTHLYRVFNANNVEIEAIWSHNIKNAAQINSSISTDNLNFEHSNSSLFIICVPDHAISSVVDILKIPDHAIVVHTSGATPMSILNKFERYGIFYPLQTFSKEKVVDFSKVPILIESTHEKDTSLLMKIAKKISDHVLECNSEQRKQIHVAAVFACNFTNYLMSISEKILGKATYSLDLLQPLVIETMEKSFELGPKNAQTGPAVRNDEDTIKKHLDLLNIADKELYNLLTKHIQKEHA